MTQYGFYFDSARCTGCKTCQVACKECNHLPADVLWRRVFDYQGGSWEKTEAGFYSPVDVYAYRVSMACNHCANPACFANCPVGAIAKDPETGIVTVDRDVCIGCKTCITACPYEVPAFDEEAGTVSKCDMCQSEIAQGRKPVCVLSCPMRALDFGDIEELKATYGAGNVEVAPLPADSTGPSLVLNPHPKAQPSVQGTGIVVNFDYEL